MTDTLPVTSLVQESESRARLVGAVLGSDILALRQEGEGWLAAVAATDCEIDVSGVSNASSMLLSLMLCWKRAALARQISLRFVGASDRLSGLATMSHVADHLGLSSH